MNLFITVLTEGHYAAKTLKKLSDNNFHGSVLSTNSFRHALMESIEPVPCFGGLSKVVEHHEEYTRPMIFVVVKDDSEVKTLAKIVNEAVGGISGKGFMYTVPVTYVEGLE